MKSDLIINNVWAMPNKNTFSIPPIKQIVEKYLSGKSVDPFANSNKMASVTNDIDPQYGTDFNLDALDFLKSLDDDSIHTVLFDPPFSPRQVSECYKKMGRVVDMQTTQASFWSNLKKEVARVTELHGIAISCGWNSGGIGKSFGFSKIEVLLVSHGGWHNDTIVTVERKREEIYK